MTYFIYSTLTADVAYTSYLPNETPAASTKEHSVLIKGGANNAVEGFKLFTPKGVATKVSDSDFEFLQKNHVFQLHHKNGFITWDKSEISVDKAVSNMTAKDQSAPKTPKDLPQKKKRVGEDDGDNA